MKKKNNNGALIGLLIGIIIMLLIVIGLFVTNTISFNNKETSKNNQEKENYQENEETKENNEKKYKDLYLNFINKKEYSIENIQEEYNKISYTTYDINNDGIQELVLQFTSEEESALSEFGYISIYTYNNNQITLIKTTSIWNGFGIKYNKNTNEIIYTEMKTSGLGDGTRGGAIGYYKIIDNKLELSRTIKYIMNLSSNETTYYEIKQNENEKIISKDSYERMRKEEINLNFIEIK